MFVVQVKPMTELKAQNYLIRKGFKAFVPMNEIYERFAGKWRTATKILFPGYVFIDIAELSADDYYKALNCDWVLRLLGQKGRPEKLQPKEIVFMRLWQNGGPRLVKLETDVIGDTYTLAGIKLKAVEINKRARRGTFEIELAGEIHQVTLSCRFEEQTNESEPSGLIRPHNGSSPT